MFSFDGVLIYRFVCVAVNIHTGSVVLMENYCYVLVLPKRNVTGLPQFELFLCHNGSCNIAHTAHFHSQGTGLLTVTGRILPSA